MKPAAVFDPATACAALPFGVQDAAEPREPVFAEPWQAQAFAMVVSLHQRGLFTWPQWAAALGLQIAKAEARGEADDGQRYYHHWLAALEDLLAKQSVAAPGELNRLVHAWEHAAARTPHGQPIELQPGDYPPPTPG